MQDFLFYFRVSTSFGPTNGLSFVDLRRAQLTPSSLVLALCGRAQSQLNVAADGTTIRGEKRMRCGGRPTLTRSTGYHE